MKKNTSYYDILGISKQSSDSEIKHAYLILAKKYHPDKHIKNKAMAAKRFQMIMEAYKALQTREKRAIYNQKLRLDAQNDNANQSGFFTHIGNWLRPAPSKTHETQK